MTTKLLAPAPYAQIQTSGGLYTADQNGVLAADASSDVIDLIRGPSQNPLSIINVDATVKEMSSHERIRGGVVL